IIVDFKFNETNRGEFSWRSCVSRFLPSSAGAHFICLGARRLLRPVDDAPGSPAGVSSLPNFHRTICPSFLRLSRFIFVFPCVSRKALVGSSRRLQFCQHRWR
ncbi:hypothetical protein PMAYCL1PPCAC_26726, partial [Pristionchus mayeri]